MEEKVFVVTNLSPDLGKAIIVGLYDSCRAAIQAAYDEYCNVCREIFHMEPAPFNPESKVCVAQNAGVRVVVSVADLPMRRTAEFPVAYVTREDVAHRGFSTEGLTDECMQQVASRMSKYISDEMEYWYALDAACEYIGISRNDDDQDGDE